METIPQPHILDPDRLLADDRGGFGTKDDRKARADLLDAALHETCEYAQKLWHDLNAVRQYLLDSLPPDPRLPGMDLTASASPTGPDDDEGWEKWLDVYAEVSSVLCGPHGDSGFGRTEAQHEADIRRTARVLAISPDARDARTDPDPEPPRPAGHEAGRSAPAWLPALQGGVVALVAAMALRGLRRQNVGTRQ
jgi:hypothetical protein